MPRTSHPNKLPQVILIFGVIILLAAAGAVVVRVFSVEDTWIQDKETGAWARHGNPQGPAPSVAVVDCYTRSAGGSYDAALAECIRTLCASSQVCINDLLDRFETLRNDSKDEAFEGNIPAGGEDRSRPVPTSNATEDFFSPPNIPQAGEGQQPSAPLEESAQTPPPASEAISAVPPASYVRVSEPAVYAAVVSPFKVLGEARAEVDSLTIKVKGANNETLITETVRPHAAAVEGWRPFKLTLFYEFSRTKAGTVEILPDGQADNMVVIPVVFR